LTLILLEGPDCGGKSALAGRLVAALRRAEPDADVRYLHSGPPDEHPLDEYVEPLLGYRPGTGVHYVCDRFHVGESVYPVVRDRPTQLTDDVRAWIELFLRSRGALLVYCKASYDYLRDCGIARGDDRLELTRIFDTQQLFDRWVVDSLLSKMIVDATDEFALDHEHTVRQVVGVAADCDRAARSLTPYVTYVGPPRPSLLLVGDRRGTPSHDLGEFGSWPAFAPRPSTSGAYLLSTLTADPLRVPTHGVQLDDVGLVNACDVDDVRACWETLGRPTVVGLGRNAQARLRQLDVPHHEAPHPQYSRRFTHHKRVEYLAQLLDDVVNRALNDATSRTNAGELA
jgi:hypothetical protein